MKPHFGQPLEKRGAPLGDSHAVMIMIHGRGATAGSILELSDAFDRPDFSYLAPPADGNTWYPHSFMAEKAMNEPGLSAGLEVIEHLLDEVVKRGFPRQRIMLLGFSQGACLAAEYAVRHPARYGGILVFSGGLIGPPGTTWPAEGTFKKTPIFLGCSDVDGHVPLTRVNESADVFERMGAAVTRRVYPGMGHTVNQDEIDFTRALMEEVAPSD
jgi:predicted esterase